jgi:hypothetical protein
MSKTTPFGYPIPTARKVSPLRQRMIEDMKVRNFALNTQESYLGQVSLFARHFGKSPEQLGPEEIRAYQIYLAEEKKVSVGTRIVAVSALRFFYAVTLQRDWTVQLIPTPKKDPQRPEARSGGQKGEANPGRYLRTIIRPGVPSKAHKHW